MNKNYQSLYLNKGFTLIEVLIVVALLAVLAVVALVAINPAEAQKKARDTQRLKQAGDLQKVMEQYLADNPSAAVFTAASTANAASNACGVGGWLGIDMCNYVNTLVVDPRNVGSGGVYITSATAAGTGGLQYQVLLNASGYRICTRLEARANAGRLVSDGLSNNFYEIYNSTNAPTCTIP